MWGVYVNVYVYSLICICKYIFRYMFVHICAYLYMYIYIETTVLTSFSDLLFFLFIYSLTIITKSKICNNIH